MIATRKELRDEFWRTHPQFKRIPGKTQNDYLVDVRIAWCEWINDLYMNDRISKGLVERATL